MVGLQEFITEAISQIVKGIVAADEIVKRHGAVVNPGGMSTRGSASTFSRFDANTGTPVEDVRFDLTVTVTEGGGEAGVKIGVASLEGNATKQIKEESVSRIAFKIPLLYPTSPNSPRSVDKPNSSEPQRRSR